MQKITPHLWFDSQAEEAATLYTSVFPDSRLGKTVRYGKEGFEIHGQPEGKVMTVQFEIHGQSFFALNGGPLFTFNPSISFLVTCGSPEEVDTLWAKLSEGGKALMPLGEYPFSGRYGWTTDRFGVSWQIMLGDVMAAPRGITPTLMYVGDQAGRAEEAMQLYASTLPESAVGHVMRWEAGEEPERQGTVKHAGFTLAGQSFAVMDSAQKHEFAFNEAISLMVHCDTQEEIDAYWARLSADPKAGQCGWLKDPYGVSWQITPKVLGKMMSDPDRAKVERVTAAFLKMKKFDIAALEEAYKG